MEILILDLKRYLYEYNKIIINILLMLILCTGIFYVVQHISSNKMFVEPFEIALVDNDNSPEINMFVNYFNENEQIGNLILIEKMSLSEAIENISLNLIPSYIEIPKNFAENIRSGENEPFKVVGNPKRPIQFLITKLISKSFVAYVSASQAGIYSTIDYAYNNGFSYNEINNKIVYPINIAFALNLLNFIDFFDVKTLSPTGALTFTEHYIVSFTLFFIMVNSIIFIKPIKEVFQKNILSMYKILNIHLWRVVLNQALVMFIIYLILCSHLFLIFGFKTILIPWVLSLFTIMIYKSFKYNSTILIFSLAIIMLFLSGGIIPIAFLPNYFSVLKLFTINYWILNLNLNFISLIVLFCLSILFLFISINISKFNE